MRMRKGQAVAAAVIMAALAGCGSGQGGAGATTARATEQATAATPSPSLTPLQQCVSVVTHLLEQSAAAVRDGYPGGINTTAVEEQYGVQSAIWQAFSTLDTQELDDFALHGAGNGDPAEVLQVPQTCQEYVTP
jgi:hypothetical protein